MTRKLDGPDLPPVDWSRFDGLDLPSWTQVPDAVFDWIMPYLTGAELKVLLYIIRRTFGFSKKEDAIGLDQFCNGIVVKERRNGVVVGERRLDFGTALKRSTVLDALRSLREKNLIIAVPQFDDEGRSLPTAYRLNKRDQSADIRTIMPGMDQALVPPQPGSQAGFHRRVPQGLPEQTPGSTIVDPGVRQDKPQGLPEQTGRVRSGRREGSARADAQETGIQKTVNQQTDDIESKGNQLSSTDQTHGTHDQTLAQRITSLVAEFGDTAAPQASVTKATKQLHGSELSPESFVALVDESAGLVRQFRPQKPMAYFFTTLENLVRTVGEEHRRATTNGHRLTEPPLIMETDEVWCAVLEEMQLTLTPENYALWFAATRGIGHDDGVCRVEVRDAFHKEWLERRLSGRIRESLNRRGFGDITLSYIIPPAGVPGTTG